MAPFKCGRRRRRLQLTDLDQRNEPAELGERPPTLSHHRSTSSQIAEALVEIPRPASVNCWTVSELIFS